MSPAIIAAIKKMHEEKLREPMREVLYCQCEYCKGPR